MVDGGVSGLKRWRLKLLILSEGEGLKESMIRTLKENEDCITLTKDWYPFSIPRVLAST